MLDAREIAMGLHSFSSLTASGETVLQTIICRPTVTSNHLETRADLLLSIVSEKMIYLTSTLTLSEGWYETKLWRTRHKAGS